MVYSHWQWSRSNFSNEDLPRIEEEWRKSLKKTSHQFAEEVTKDESEIFQKWTDKSIDCAQTPEQVYWPYRQGEYTFAVVQYQRPSTEM